MAVKKGVFYYLYPDINVARRMNFPTQESEENSITREEQTLPKLYSKGLILIFSILFSTIFAAALLVSNLRRLGKKAAAAWVLAFALTYIVATALVMQAFNLSPSLTLIANVIGAAILNEVFWNKYIGSDTEYEKKSWIKPTAISVGIVIVMFSLMMVST